ncbi:hypothetical protein WJX72_001259 [[Myrmecia] bisecta]|uniref:beta-fructofuranosidase n=1 Tax=[Myrmecia] bisecta TaxID=41462 RepID=A0AAW1PR91_9CHLO
MATLPTGQDVHVTSDGSAIEKTSDYERPIYHVMPPKGWLSDPNAPLYVNGRYHLFYQHLPDSVEWKFGICWGHACSTDLVHWQHLPPGIAPTKGGYDADGCFSGCGIVWEGVPYVLYTGVRLRHNPDIPALPDKEDDIGLPFVETQLCAAHADPRDPLLRRWIKDDCSHKVLPVPPKEMRPAARLKGWRDPFIFELPSRDNGGEFSMLLGNGTQEKGGCVLLYKAKDPIQDWRFAGVLCEVPEPSLGMMWECPMLLPLTQPPASFEEAQCAKPAEKFSHLLSLCPDAPINRPLYWLGNYKDDKFDMETADGPFPMDLGDVGYALNTLADPSGRTLLWSWLQEGAVRNTEYDKNYSGCMSVVRELYIQNNRLLQRPARELHALRVGCLMRDKDPQQLTADELLPVPDTRCPALDMELVMKRGSASASGVLVGCWPGAATSSAAILYNWETKELNVVFDTYSHSAKTGRVSVGDLEGQARTIGGPVQIEKDAIQLRILIDGSVVEVFTDAGVILTTRIYRGAPPAGETSSGLGFISVGGSVTLAEAEVWEMEDCWTNKPEFYKASQGLCTKAHVASAQSAVLKPWGTIDAGRCHACRGLHKHGECPVGMDGPSCSGAGM